MNAHPKTLSRQFLVDLFSNALDGIPGAAPIMIHSDIAQVGLVEGAVTPSAMSEAYETALRDAAAGRPLLFPTFNYDCGGSGVFDVVKDIGQVGALSRYFSKKYPAERTRTPIFNFYIMNNNGRFSMEPAEYPLGAGSTFEHLSEQNGYLMILGLPDSRLSLTISHYVETLAEMGYRYDKSFDTQIIDETGASTPHRFTMHVRPRVPGLVEYVPLLADPALVNDKSMDGVSLWTINAKEYVEESLRDLRDDELKWLTDGSRAEVTRMYAEHGRPLRKETFET